jgi:hypothetical protein
MYVVGRSLPDLKGHGLQPDLMSNTVQISDEKRHNLTTGTPMSARSLDWNNITDNFDNLELNLKYKDTMGSSDMVSDENYIELAYDKHVNTPQRTRTNDIQEATDKVTTGMQKTI